jgi:hypothetical protein
MGGGANAKRLRLSISRHQAINAKIPLHLLISLRPIALDSDGLRRSVIYRLSLEHEHLRPGFRNHTHNFES